MYTTKPSGKSEMIRTRQLEIDLSDSDLNSLIKKAENAGITVNELLGCFIGDLVAGARSRGSDERNLANMWFERCGFEYVAANSFLRFALWNEILEDIIELYEDIQSAKKEILECTTYPENHSAEDLQLLQENLTYCQQEMMRYWNEYMGTIWEHEPTDPGKTLEEEIVKLVCWKENSHKILEGKSC